MAQLEGLLYPHESDPVTGRSRLRMATLPTPYEQAPRLASALGLSHLYIKREDMAGYALGGNKLRQIDFLLAEALAAGADVVISTAGSQSNFCRSLAGACAKLGLACHLHLRSKMGTEKVGNLLLDDLFGAKVTFTASTDPWDPAARAELEAISESYRDSGKTPHVIQLTGASAVTAVAGWVLGGDELAEDIERASQPLDWVMVTCGSGLTLAGIALSFKQRGLATKCIGVSAQQPADRLSTWILDTANAAAESIGLDIRLDRDDFIIIDTEVAPGYGLPSPQSIDSVRMAARYAGLLLDPIYTGKGMAGLRACIASGTIKAGASVAFLHSGGTPGIFTHADVLAS